MKRKVLGVLLSVAMVATMVAGCGSSSEPAATDDAAATEEAAPAEDAAEEESTDTAAAGGKIGISMPTQSLERWNRDGAYLDEQFQAAGYETVLTYSDNDSARQVNDIQNMLADGVDLLIVAAIDGEALNTAMDEAATAGVPVIAYDRLIMNDAVSYYVSFDNYTVGTLQGQFIVDTLDLENAGDTVYNMEITAGDPADNNAGYFYQGAIDVLQPYIDAGTLNVVSGQTDFDTVATAQWSTDITLTCGQLTDALCHTEKEYMFVIPANVVAKAKNTPVYVKIVVNKGEKNEVTFTKELVYTSARPQLSNMIFNVNDGKDKDGKIIPLMYNPSNAVIIKDQLDLLTYIREYNAATEPTDKKDAFLCSVAVLDFSRDAMIKISTEMGGQNADISNYLANGFPSIKSFSNTITGNGAVIKDVQIDVNVAEPLTLCESDGESATIKAVLSTDKSKWTMLIRLFRRSRGIEVENIVDWNEKHKLAKAEFSCNLLARKAL